MLWPSEHLPRFVESFLELDSLAESAKSFACKHCGKVGTLIGHGFLRGYEERSSALCIRAKRFFCSNRGRRGGCGRTVSAFLSFFVPYFTIMTLSLWRFFHSLCDNLSVSIAAFNSHFPLGPRSAYRITIALKRASLNWRSWLERQGTCLLSSETSPLAQLRLQLLDKLGLQPFSTWQSRVQSSLL